MKAPIFLGIFMAAALSSATVLTFDIDNLTNGSLMPQSYGDNVTATTMGGHHYGAAYGFTPDVTASYVGLGSQADVNFWETGYGDLVNVIEYEPDGDPGYKVGLTASTSVVQLQSFDLGNWGSQVTLKNLSVVDGGGGVLFSQNNIVVPGSGTNTHLSFDFTSAPLTASSLFIVLDLTGLGGNSDNMGLDNIAFGQAQAVPEPATCTMLALGAVLLRRRRQKR
ncbi:MAG: hypothetical protein JSS65_07230 [Armatimonadetes bacterium]|nr:hypothetical protein [Armatimonadota bacterium]